jgi:hypothetical protein
MQAGTTITTSSAAQCQRVFDVHACPGDLSRLAPAGLHGRRARDHAVRPLPRLRSCRRRRRHTPTPAAAAADGRVHRGRHADARALHAWPALPCLPLAVAAVAWALAIRPRRASAPHPRPAAAPAIRLLLDGG